MTAAQILIQEKGGYYTALHQAAKTGDVLLVKELMKYVQCLLGITMFTRNHFLILIDRIAIFRAGAGRRGGGTEASQLARPHYSSNQLTFHVRGAACGWQGGDSPER